MNKQTAVEWLVQQMGDKEYILWNDKPWWDELVKLIEQAKAMEKEQIIDAQMDMFNNTNKIKFGLDYLNKRDAAEEYAEQYYNETFKSE